jgi:hypothetical protein
LIQKARTKKKGRALKVTRPKPTIYGNCDSWNFIVGKTGRAYSRQGTPTGPLRAGHGHIIHNLSTISVEGWGDKLWAACGCAGTSCEASRIVVDPPADMQEFTRLDRGFYRKTSLSPTSS